MLSDDQIHRIAAGESPIRVLREHRGMTELQLARGAGLTVDRLRRLEKGRGTVREERLRRIADVLGVRVLDLRPCQEHFDDCAERQRWSGTNA